MEKILVETRSDLQSLTEEKKDILQQLHESKQEIEKLKQSRQKERELQKEEKVKIRLETQESEKKVLKDYETLKGQYENVVSEQKTLAERAKKMEQELASNESQITQLKKSEQVHEHVLKQVKTLEKQLAAEKIKHEKYVKEREHLEKQHKTKEDLLTSQLTALNKALETTKQEKETAIAEKKSKESEMKAKLKELEDSLVSAEEERQEMSSKVGTQAFTIEALNRSVSDKEAAIGNLKSELEDYVLKSNEKVDYLNATIADLSQTTTQRDNELALLKIQRDRALEEFNKLSRDHKALINDFAKSENDMESMKKFVDNQNLITGGKDQQISALSSQLHQAMQMLDQRKAQLPSYEENELVTVKEQNEKLSELVDNLKATLEQKDIDYARAKENLTFVTNELAKQNLVTRNLGEKLYEKNVALAAESSGRFAAEERIRVYHAQYQDLQKNTKDLERQLNEQTSLNSEQANAIVQHMLNNQNQADALVKSMKKEKKLAVENAALETTMQELKKWTADFDRASTGKYNLLEKKFKETETKLSEALLNLDEQKELLKSAKDQELAQKTYIDTLKEAARAADLSTFKAKTELDEVIFELKATREDVVFLRDALDNAERVSDALTNPNSAATQEQKTEIIKNLVSEEDAKDYENSVTVKQTLANEIIQNKIAMNEAISTTVKEIDAFIRNNTAVYDQSEKAKEDQLRFIAFLNQANEQIETVKTETEEKNRVAQISISEAAVRMKAVENQAVNTQVERADTEATKNMSPQEAAKYLREAKKKRAKKLAEKANPPMTEEEKEKHAKKMEEQRILTTGERQTYFNLGQNVNPVSRPMDPFDPQNPHFGSSYDYPRVREEGPEFPLPTIPSVERTEFHRSRQLQLPLTRLTSTLGDREEVFTSLAVQQSVDETPPSAREEVTTNWWGSVVNRLRSIGNSIYNMIPERFQDELEQEGNRYIDDFLRNNPDIQLTDFERHYILNEYRDARRDMSFTLGEGIAFMNNALDFVGERMAHVELLEHDIQQVISLARGSSVPLEYQNNKKDFSNLPIHPSYMETDDKPKKRTQPETEVTPATVEPNKKPNKKKKKSRNNPNA